MLAIVMRAVKLVKPADILKKYWTFTDSGYRKSERA